MRATRKPSEAPVANGPQRNPVKARKSVSGQLSPGNLGAELRRFLDLVLGETEGVLCAAFGVNGYINARGKYTFRKGDWRERAFAWPDDFDDLLRHVTASAGSDTPADAYACMALRPLGVTERRKDGALGPMTCWVDLDGPPVDAALYGALEPLRLVSGSPGHEHGFVLLSEPASSREMWRTIQETLRDRLAGDDKIADNDVLRMPGTLNRKHEPPSEVRVIEWSERRWHPDELAELLGVDLTATPKRVTKPKRKATSRAHREATVSTSVERAMRHGEELDDRSAAMHHVVKACKRDGLSLAETVDALADYEPAVDKYGDRLDAEIQRSWDKPDDETDEEYEHEVADRLRKLRVERDARERFDAERNGAIDLPAVISLDEFLTEPDDETVYRVDSLWPVGGRVLLAAAFKAGKTTLLGNLLRSLVDGTPFLGNFEVEPVSRVVLIDDELDERTLRRWLRTSGVRDAARVSVISLRGKVSSFDILSEAGRKRWAERIGSADVLILDCLRPVLDAYGLSEDHDAGRFLVAFDALCDQAEIGEAVIAHHMGHAGERSRGDSRLRDWPDAEWKLVRERSHDGRDDDPRASRYFSAYGRDVDVPEGLLAYDELMRTLRWVGGSRTDTRFDEQVRKVVAAIERAPGGVVRSQAQLEEMVGGNRDDVRRAWQEAVRRNKIIHEVGDRNAHIFRVATPTSPTSPDLASSEVRTTSPARPIRARGRVRGSANRKPRRAAGEVEAAAALHVQTRSERAGEGAPL